MACAIFFASSAAKLLSLQFGAASNYLAVAWPHLVLMVSAIEFIVATGMVLDRFGKTSLVAANVLFGAFTAVSGTLLLNGVTSCACFGGVDTSVASVFTLDLGLTIGLGWVLLTGVRNERIGWKTLRTSAVVASGLLALSFTLDNGQLPEGVARFLARLRGDDLVIKPQVLDLGVGQPRESSEHTLCVSNLCDRDLRILGQLSKGSWEIRNPLPASIAPYGDTNLAVSVRFPNKPGLFADSLALYVSGGDRQVLRIKFRGLCREE